MSERINESDTERILARVAKMLALANDAGATEGERDNALRMAHATLAKYGLSLAEAEAKGSAPEAKRTRTNLKTRKEVWVAWLASAVADLFFCRSYFMADSRNKTYFFIGREANAVTAAEMLAYLVSSIFKEAAKVKPS